MTIHARAQATTDTPAVAVPTLQRACACGAAAGVSGKCTDCTAAERLGLQPKLTINPPSDYYEQEADRITEHVLAVPRALSRGPVSVTPRIQPQRIEEEEDEALQAKPLQRQEEDEQEEEALQRKPDAHAAGPASTAAATSMCAVARQAGERIERVMCRSDRGLQRETSHEDTAPPIVYEVLRGPGQPLDMETRAFVEPRFGYDFSRVRVHTGSRAGDSSKAVGAQAYTVGHNIVFGSGRFAPETEAGKRLLVHELAHVVQQGASRPVNRASPSSTTQGSTRGSPWAGRSAVRPGSYGIRLALPSGDRWILPPSISDVRQGPEGEESAVGAAAGAESGPERSGPELSAPAENLPVSRIDERLQRRAVFTNPSPTPQDPLARLVAGGPPGLTTPKINGSVVSNVTQILGHIAPSRVSGTVSGGSATCRFDPSFTIDTSADVIVARNPRGHGWTGSITPAALGNPPACSGVSGSIPALLVATPSNSDFVTRVRNSEQEHVDALRELHNRHFVPFDTFVTGLRGTGASLADCGRNLVTLLGQRHTQAAFGFLFGYSAETQRLDGPGGTHVDNAVPSIGSGCRSVTLTLSQTNAPIPGATRGNVVTVAPTVTTYDIMRLSVSGSNVVERLTAGATRVIHRFSSEANARVGLHVFQHYGTTSKNVIGKLTYLLVNRAAPAGSGSALTGVTEESIDPDRVQVSFGVPGQGDWAITQVDGNNVRVIVNFGGSRNEAFSAVDVLRNLRVTKFALVGSRSSPDLIFFRQ